MIAFTYLIGWSNLDKWYYGSRFARNSSPSDLWTIYFTSSKIVKRFREEHGEPDVVQVRKIFESGAAARKWEGKVLTRLDARNKSKWLNINRNNHKILALDETMKAKRQETIARKYGNGSYRDANVALATVTAQRRKDNGSYVTGKQKERISKKDRYGDIAKKIAEKREQSGSYNAVCPHCLKAGRIPGMFRWHFDLCRQKKSSLPKSP